MPKSDEGVFSVSKFKGLRNTVAEDQFDVGDLSVAKNVDLLDSGDIQVRKGNSAAKDANATHSIWARGALCLMVQGTTLYRLKTDYTKVVLRTGLTANAPMSYEIVGSRVYYTNGAQRGVIENFVNRSWGLEVPAAPIGTASAGALPPGRYQFLVTYERSDGQESGAGLAGSVTIADPENRSRAVSLPPSDSRFQQVDVSLTGELVLSASGGASTSFFQRGAAAGGILFTDIPVPTDTDVVMKHLYLTKPNGDVFYRYAQLAVGTTTSSALALRHGTVALKTQHFGPPPADGVIVANFNGCLLVVSGNAIYPSEPYAFELFDRRKRYPLLDRIVTVACMTDGVHCGTLSQNVWLGGKDPAQWTYDETADYGAIPGSLAFASGSQLGKGDKSGSVGFVMTTRGVCLLGDGGVFRNLTEERFAYPSGETGAGLVRRHGGMNQYVGVMRGITSAGNSYN